MWFPDNNPCPGNRQLNNSSKHKLVTTETCRPRQPPSIGEHRACTKGYGGHSVGETPGPIPNPEAKTHSADGTAPGRVWESRSPPEHHSRSRTPNHVGGPPAFNDENDAQPPTDQSVGERRRET